MRSVEVALTVLVAVEPALLPAWPEAFAALTALTPVMLARPVIRPFALRQRLPFGSHRAFALFATGGKLGAFANAFCRMATLFALWRCDLEFFLRLLARAAQDLRRKLSGRLRRLQDAEIMFGKLVVAFSRNIVAGGMRIAPELHVFLGNGLRRAAHLYVRPVALIHAVDRIAAAMLASATAA